MSILVLIIALSVIILLAGAKVAWKYYRRREELKDISSPILAAEKSPGTDSLSLQEGAEAERVTTEEGSLPEEAAAPQDENPPPGDA